MQSVIEVSVVMPIVVVQNVLRHQVSEAFFVSINT
jgi:hypothetical protein